MSSGLKVAVTGTPESNNAAAILLACSADRVAQPVTDSPSSTIVESINDADFHPKNPMRPEPAGNATGELLMSSEQHPNSISSEPERSESHGCASGDLPMPNVQCVIPNPSVSMGVVSQEVASGDFREGEDDPPLVEMGGNIREDTMADLRLMSPEPSALKVNPMIVVPQSGLTYLEIVSIKDRFKDLVDLPSHHALHLTDFSSKLSRDVQVAWGATNFIYESLVDIASDPMPQATDAEIIIALADLPSKVSDIEVVRPGKGDNKGA
jgi:hypothetical protein